MTETNAKAVFAMCSFWARCLDPHRNSWSAAEPRNKRLMVLCEHDHFTLLDAMECALVLGPQAVIMRTRRGLIAESPSDSGAWIAARSRSYGPEGDGRARDVLARWVVQRLQGMRGDSVLVWADGSETEVSGGDV